QLGGDARLAAPGDAVLDEDVATDDVGRAAPQVLRQLVEQQGLGGQDRDVELIGEPSQLVQLAVGDGLLEPGEPEVLQLSAGGDRLDVRVAAGGILHQREV